MNGLTSFIDNKKDKVIHKHNLLRVYSECRVYIVSVECNWRWQFIQKLEVSLEIVWGETLEKHKEQTEKFMHFKTIIVFWERL